MRNLKKVLSMIMAVAMMMSLVVFSASATSFNDDKNIVNKEAVDMATALKIINGLPDGSFNPTGNVTRAEMAKMICILLNGGNEPTVGAKTGNPTFNDIRGHWAEGYIEYCVAEGIIAGMGDGTFQPNGNVTGTQAAKMLLVALGYRAEAEGFNGANWAVKINVRATQKKLYDDITVASVNNPLSRDNAAQMIWNALNATVVQYDYELITVNGQLQSVLTAKDVMIGATTDPLTLMADKYKQSDAIGTLGKITWSTKDKIYTYELDNVRTGDPTTFKSTKDYSNLFGLKVKAVYKTNKQDNTLFGMMSYESSVLATGLLGDIDFDKNGDTSFTVGDQKINVDTNYKYASTASGDTLHNGKVTNVGGMQLRAMNDTVNVEKTLKDLLETAGPTSGKFTDVALAYQMSVLDTDNNGKADTIAYIPVVTAQVDSVTSKSISLTDEKYVNTADFGHNLGSAILNLNSNTIYDGVEEDDFVAIIPDANNPFEGNQVVKMDTFESTIDGMKKATQIRASSNWYDLVKFDDTFADADMDSSYTFAVIGSYVFYTDKTAGTASMKDLLFLAEVEPMGRSYDGLAYFTDGTSKVIKIVKTEAKDSTGKKTSTTPADGQLYTFSEKSGDYTLLEVNDYNLVGQKSFLNDAAAGSAGDVVIAASVNNKPGELKLNNTAYSIADDAVVFTSYLDSNGNVKATVITGKQAKDLGVKFGGLVGDSGQALFSKATQSGLVKVAVVVTTDTNKPKSGDTGKYAFILSSIETRDSDSNRISELKIWNGTEERTVTYDGDRADVPKGGLIEYIDLGNNEIDVETVLAGADYSDAAAAAVVAGGTVAVTDVNGNVVTITRGGDVPGASTKVYTTKDTVYMYVDTSGPDFLKSGSIKEAKKDLNLVLPATSTDPKATTGNSDTTVLVPNAFVLAEDDGAGNLEVLLIVVDGDYYYQLP